jgi:ComF family protein
MFKTFLNSLLDFIFPPFCASCHKRMPEGQRGLICSPCWDQAERWEGMRCQRCGAAVSQMNEPQLCPGCLIEDWACDDIRTIGPFRQPLSEAVHLLKYSDRRSAAASLAAQMLKPLSAASEYQGADLIIAVPLHPARQRERGYNQAHLLAVHLSKALGKSSPENVVKRAKHTKTQTRLNKQERRENVKDIFTVKKPELVKGKTVILVDDVLTTGATIGSCARALKEAGAVKVLALTAAAAPLDS